MLQTIIKILKQTKKIILNVPKKDKLGLKVKTLIIIKS